MAKNYNHYAFVICDEEGNANPASSLFFSSRTEATNAFSAVKGRDRTGHEETGVRVYVLKSDQPIEFSSAKENAERALKANEWERHGWKILVSEFPQDMVLNSYTEPLTNEEHELADSIAETLRPMPSGRPALILGGDHRQSPVLAAKTGP